MKTFLRKMKLSFLAMLCGWIACNIVVWVCAGYYELFISDKRDPFFMAGMRVFGLCSGIVILSVWLVIFLPVDLFVRDDSWLRQPKTAARAGFASACLFVLVCSGFTGSASALLAMIVLAGLTGTTAAYVRARMDRKKHQAEPP